jgi:uncharacterized protein
MQTTDRAGLHVLSADECLDLLATHPVHIGRVGFVTDGRPVVLPVNYRYRDGAVIIRTASPTLLAAVARGDEVAFEVDSVNVAWEEGWSVLVQGRPAEVVDPGQLQRLESVPLRTWAPAEPARYVRIPVTAVTGRRIA